MTDHTVRPTRLVLAGGLAVDLVLRVDELPRRGDDVRARSAYAEVGAGFVLLATARRHGLPAAYAGRYGGGPFGAAVAAGLTAEGVDLLLPRDETEDTGFRTTVAEPVDGQLSVTSPGVEARLDRATLTGVRPRAGDVVHVAGRDLAQPSTGPAVAAWLDTLPASVRVAFDPGRWLDVIPWRAQERVLRRCDLLTTSADAVRRLVGTHRHGPAWRALREYAPRLRLAAVRTPADGCWVGVPDDGPVEVPTPPVDAPGGPAADEVHTGVLLAGLALGMTPRRAALRANVATALRTAGRGSPPCPDPAAVDRFLAGRWPVE